MSQDNTLSSLGYGPQQHIIFPLSSKMAPLVVDKSCVFQVWANIESEEMHSPF